MPECPPTFYKPGQDVQYSDGPPDKHAQKWLDEMEKHKEVERYL